MGAEVRAAVSRKTTTKNVDYGFGHCLGLEYDTTCCVLTVVGARSLSLAAKKREDCSIGLRLLEGVIHLVSEVLNIVRRSKGLVNSESIKRWLQRRLLLRGRGWCDLPLGSEEARGRGKRRQQKRDDCLQHRPLLGRRMSNILCVRKC